MSFKVLSVLVHLTVVASLSFQLTCVLLSHTPSNLSYLLMHLVSILRQQEAPSAFPNVLKRKAINFPVPRPDSCTL